MKYEMAPIENNEDTLKRLSNATYDLFGHHLSADTIVDVISNWNLICSYYYKNKSINVAAEKKLLKDVIRGLEAGLKALKTANNQDIYRHNLIYKKSNNTEQAISLLEKELRLAKHTRIFFLHKNNISLDHDAMLDWGLNVLFHAATELGLKFPGVGGSKTINPSSTKFRKQ